MRRLQRAVNTVQTFGLGVVLFLFLGLTATANAEESEKFTNLQIIPDNIERQALFDLMGQYRTALGVSCSHCHVPAKDDKDKMDYASDEKPAKEIAREMMLITQKINQTLMPNLGRTPVLEVQCITCHHGLTRPSTLPVVLRETYNAQGLQATVKKYEELREQYYGRGSFDFKETVLLNLAADLQKTAEEDAVSYHLLQLNLKYFPNSVLSLYRLGKVYRDRKDHNNALTYFKKVLEIDPNHRWAKKNVARLENPNVVE